MASTTYYWDEVNDNLFGEEDENGDIVASYMHEPGLYGKIIARKRGDDVRYYNFDGLGNTSELTDENGDVTDTYEYSAFGELVARTGTTENSFEYMGASGYYTDAETGDISDRAQMYEPKIGRWLNVRLYLTQNQKPFPREITCSGNVITYDIKKLNKCIRMIQGVVAGTYLLNSRCLRELFRSFLNPKAAPSPCPKECLNLLSRATTFNMTVEDFVRERLQLFGLDGLIVCPSTGRIEFDFGGQYEFTVPKDGLELFGAFHYVSWRGHAACSWTCNQRNLSCCCACRASCGYQLRIKDEFDFCSTLPKRSSKLYDLAECAAILEKNGNGRKFNISCHLPIHRFNRVFRACPRVPDNIYPVA